MRQESKCDELSDGKHYVTFPMEIKDVDKTTGIVIGFCNHGWTARVVGDFGI